MKELLLSIRYSFVYNPKTSFCKISLKGKLQKKKKVNTAMKYVYLINH